MRPTSRRRKRKQRRRGVIQCSHNLPAYESHDIAQAKANEIRGTTSWCPEAGGWHAIHEEDA